MSDKEKLSDKTKHDLVIRLTSDEADLLRRAAASTGADREAIASWAKKQLLKYAKTIAPPPEIEFDSGFEILPAPPAPQCFCGETRDPSGACDGSCIMRY